MLVFCGNLMHGTDELEYICGPSSRKKFDCESCKVGEDRVQMNTLPFFLRKTTSPFLVTLSFPLCCLLYEKRKGLSNIKTKITFFARLSLAPTPKTFD